MSAFKSGELKETEISGWVHEVGSRPCYSTLPKVLVPSGVESHGRGQLGVLRLLT